MTSQQFRTLLNSPEFMLQNPNSFTQAELRQVGNEAHFQHLFLSPRGFPHVFNTDADC